MQLLQFSWLCAEWWRFFNHPKDMYQAEVNQGNTLTFFPAIIQKQCMVYWFICCTIFLFIAGYLAVWKDPQECQGFCPVIKHISLLFDTWQPIHKNNKVICIIPLQWQYCKSYIYTYYLIHLMVLLAINWNADESTIYIKQIV